MIEDQTDGNLRIHVILLGLQKFNDNLVGNIKEVTSFLNKFPILKFVSL